jgi:hypothetical protein
VNPRKAHLPANRPVRGRRSAVRRSALIVAFASFACLLVAGPAVAASPWWQLGSGSRPAAIQPGAAQSEVQQLAVSATGGSFKLILAPGESTSASTESIPFNASAAVIQSALEAVPSIGAGNVEVTGGPAASAPLTIAFEGALADQRLKTLGTDAIKLSGGAKQATVTELVTGRPDGEVVINAENLGDAVLDGEANPVTIADVLPPGLKAIGIAANRPQGEDPQAVIPLDCSLALLSCTLEGPLAPYQTLEVRIPVLAQPGAQSGEQNEVNVTGGAIAAASLSRPIVLAGSAEESTPFGVEDFRTRFEEEGGAPALQAGSHPFQMTTTVAINQGPDVAPLENDRQKPDVQPAVLAKDVITKFPSGFIGNPTPFVTCSLAQFLTGQAGGADGNPADNNCPATSAVGVASVSVNEPTFVHFSTFTVPLFNLEPYFGEPARLGFYIAQGNVPVVLDASVRSGAAEGAIPGQSEDYGVNVNANNISQTAGLLSARVTVWGTPGDPRHDNSRGWSCLYQTAGADHAPCESATQAHPPAFLTAPTSCAGPMLASVDADSWLDPGVLANFLPSEALPSLDGCNQLPFGPTIHAEPTTGAATSPTGLNFDLNVPNEGFTNSEGLAASEIKRAVVTLPQGFTSNPSVAEGLKACSLAEYRATTIQPGSGCNEESKIGTVEAESPVVTQTVKGSLFVAKQGENPYNNLLTLYMVLRNAELGVLVKQALKVTPDPLTGQLTTELDNSPQLPISHFKLAFRQGQRSPLITPPACGTYAVKAALYPWSEPDVPVQRESAFQITSGPEGQGCPSGGTPPFHPGLEAGTQNNAAGSYSPFYVHMTRKDSEQEITHFSIKLPPGVSGKLAGIPYCSDAGIAQAKSLESVLGGGSQEEASPSCPKASEVGHSLVGSGVGNVLAYAPGKMYLAGPYHGSNLSLVSITAAKVGPFDLGTVVVRFALKIDPETAEVSVDGATSDPIPHIVDGIPVHLRDIRAYVDRPQFVLNPTSCKKTSTASTVLGSGLNFASEADDQPVTVTSPFQAADCASLGFAPKLALSLKGGTKRGSTPAFKAVLTYPKGSYANIASSQVTLPHSEFLEQSHIKTICTRVQFKEGKVPGEKCPAASIYGRARAVTPILDEPLEGPVYLRSSSHNLPDLVASLNNRQVNIALDGRIDSVENGRIRNTFEAVPDAPVSKFVLEMQGGKKGLLVNSTNLCAHTNRAISEFTGQNGKLHNTNPVLSAKCGGKGKKKGNGHNRARGPR